MELFGWGGIIQKANMIRTKWVLGALIILLILLPFISCSKGSLKCSSSVDCASVTYSGTIGPLVDSKCNLAGCHLGSFNTYAGLKAAADDGALEYQVVTSQNMPAGSVSMSCEQRAQIQCWIDAGAPNN